MSDVVRNPEDRFSYDTAHLMADNQKLLFTALRQNEYITASPKTYCKQTHECPQLVHFFSHNAENKQFFMDREEKTNFLLPELTKVNKQVTNIFLLLAL